MSDGGLSPNCNLKAVHRSRTSFAEDPRALEEGSDYHKMLMNVTIYFQKVLE